MQKLFFVLVACLLATLSGAQGFSLDLSVTNLSYNNSVLGSSGSGGYIDLAYNPGKIDVNVADNTTLCGNIDFTVSSSVVFHAIYVADPNNATFNFPLNGTTAQVNYVSGDPVFSVTVTSDSYTQDPTANTFPFPTVGILTLNFTGTNFTFDFLVMIPLNPVTTTTTTTTTPVPPRRSVEVERGAGPGAHLQLASGSGVFEVLAPILGCGSSGASTTFTSSIWASIL